MPPLDGIRVLDFSRHLPGPYATDLLQQLGAEILKIEPPDGDPTRWLPPIIDDYGALFHLVNGGKESIVADLKTAEGRRFVHRLAEVCDVAVESYHPETASRFGVDAATLTRINPRLVHCSVSGYGAGSPRSSHDLNFVALAGMLDLQRDSNGRPVLPSTQIGDMSGGLFAALSIVAALFERQTTDSGRSIDISMADATRAVMPTAEALYRGTNETPESFFLTGALPSYNVYETADGGYLAVASLEPKFWVQFCQAIGLPELIERQYDRKASEEIRAKVSDAIRRKTRVEWEAIFATVDACVSPVLSIEEAHERFGDPVERHPIRRNFGSTTAPAPRLGASFERAAGVAGLSADEALAFRKTGAFDGTHQLRQLITTSVLKLRQKGLFRR
jgi:crotonobetainyl-CoA:carnitine CoA-transferase CaiB-like acyl-CoA transferase